MIEDKIHNLILGVLLFMFNEKYVVRERVMCHIESSLTVNFRYVGGEGRGRRGR